MSNAPVKETATEHFHQVVSKNALSMWGVENVSYIKNTMVEDKLVWAIYGAEGTLITTAPTREEAFAIVKQCDFEPMSAH